MPGPRRLDPSSSPRALLGAPLFLSGSFIGQLESGVRRMQMDQAEKFDEMLTTSVADLDRVVGGGLRS